MRLADAIAERPVLRDLFQRLALDADAVLQRLAAMEDRFSIHAQALARSAVPGVQELPLAPLILGRS